MAGLSTQLTASPRLISSSPLAPGKSSFGFFMRQTFALQPPFTMATNELLPVGTACVQPHEDPAPLGPVGGAPTLPNRGFAGFKLALRNRVLAPFASSRDCALSPSRTLKSLMTESSTVRVVEARARSPGICAAQNLRLRSCAKLYYYPSFCLQPATIL